MNNQPEETEDDGLSRDEVRKSALNRLSLSEIDKQYSSRAKGGDQSVVDERLIPMIAAAGTALVLFIIVGGGLIAYRLFFSTDISSKDIMLESVELSESKQETTSTASVYCVGGFGVPEQVCQAILSVQQDKTASNLFLSANAVSQLSALPDGTQFTVDESTWEVIGESIGFIVVDADVAGIGKVSARVSLEKIGEQWTILEVTII